MYKKAVITNQKRNDVIEDTIMIEAIVLVFYIPLTNIISRAELLCPNENANN